MEEKRKLKNEKNVSATQTHLYSIEWRNNNNYYQHIYNLMQTNPKMSNLATHNFVVPAVSHVFVCECGELCVEYILICTLFNIWFYTFSVQIIKPNKRKQKMFSKSTSNYCWNERLFGRRKKKCLPSQPHQCCWMDTWWKTKWNPLKKNQRSLSSS